MAHPRKREFVYLTPRNMTASPPAKSRKAQEPSPTQFHSGTIFHDSGGLLEGFCLARGSCPTQSVQHSPCDAPGGPTLADAREARGLSRHSASTLRQFHLTPCPQRSGERGKIRYMLREDRKSWAHDQLFRPCRADRAILSGWSARTKPLGRNMPQASVMLHSCGFSERKIGMRRAKGGEQGYANILPQQDRRPVIWHIFFISPPELKDHKGILYIAYFPPSQPPNSPTTPRGQIIKNHNR